MNNNNEELRAFLRSTDFLRLGQAISMNNQQLAITVINGMQRDLAAMESDLFARELISLKQCIANGATADAQEILAHMTVRRVQLQKELGDV